MAGVSELGYHITVKRYFIIGFWHEGIVSQVDSHGRATHVIHYFGEISGEWVLILRSYQALIITLGRD